MISVPNRRLRLSGNKWLVIILFNTGLWGCGASRTAEIYTPIVTTPVVKEQPVVVTETVEEKKEEKKEEKEKEEEVVGKTLTTKQLKLRYEQFNVPQNIKKDTYTVAVILPFRLDKIPDNVTDPRNVTFTTPTKIAAEFYQGVTEALDSLRTLNVHLKVHILDIDTDTIIAKQALTKAPFPNVDLMIGPVYNSNLRIYAQYARENKIPIFSPLSSSSTITDNNPYYFSANATARTHQYSILNKILQDEPAAKIWLLKGTGDETEDFDLVKEVFQEDFAPLYPAAKLAEIKFSFGDSTLYPRHFTADRTNHLVIPSYNEDFTRKAVGLLLSVDSLVPLRVYGTPKWEDYKIDYAINPFVTVYITTPYYYNPYSIFGKSFREYYKEVNRRDPSEYTLQGYDLTWYIGNLLAKGGFFNGIAQGIQVGGFLHTDYSFAPVYDKENPTQIDYFDNKFVHWLYYRDGKFTKAGQ